jgi:hypothetical protein
MSAIARAARFHEDKHKGLDAVRCGIACALNPDSLVEAKDYAEGRWGSNSRSVEILAKAAVPALNVQQGTGDNLSGPTVGPNTELFDLVRAASVVGRLAVRRIPFFAPQISMDEGPRVEWCGEGKATKITPFKATRQDVITPLKVAGAIVQTNELLMQADINTELTIRDQIVKALATAIDLAFIDPANSGSAGVKPASVTNGAIQGNSPTEALFDWGDVYTGDPLTSVILMNPWQAARMYSAARPDIGANGGTWGGFPVLTTTAVPEGTFVLLDPTKIAVAMGGAELTGTNVGAIELSDAPSQTSGTSVSAVNLTSLFQTDCSAIMGMISANWRVITAGAVQTFDSQAFGL